MTDKKAKQEYVNRVAFPKTENDADDDENDTETTNAAVEIEIEVERDDWIPDGGWGWGVVAGAVIIHVYVGKIFDIYDRFNKILVHSSRKD